MGSSGGGNYQQPATPSPPPGMIAGQGQAAPFDPQFTSFLPSDGSMATGLTPEMLASINRPQPAIPTPGGGAPAGPSDYVKQLQQALAGLGGGAGGPSGPVPGSGVGSQFMNAMYNRAGGGGNDGSPQTRGDLMRPQIAAMSGQIRNIPAPTGSSVAPGDVAAYQAAQAKQTDLRNQLAKLQMQANSGKGRWRLPGSKSGGGER